MPTSCATRGKGKKHSKYSMCVCESECHVTLHGTLDVVPFFLSLQLYDSHDRGMLPEEEEEKEEER